MQQQKTGQGLQQGQTPNTKQERNMQGNENRPEVENPLPTRKVEEPIIGNAMQADSGENMQQGSADQTEVSGNKNRTDS